MVSSWITIAIIVFDKRKREKGGGEEEQEIREVRAKEERERRKIGE